jgi:hypothetical protein
LGKVMLQAPEISSAYRAERKIPFMFFASGRAKILGGWAATVWAWDLPVKRPFERVELPVFEANKTMEATLDTFMSQRVLCYRGEWVTRNDVVKYVANVASGVHSGTPKEASERILARIRGAVSYRRKDGGIHLELFPKGVDVDDETFQHTPDAFDPVLVELLAAATFFVESEFVSELERVVRAELGE